ncbi:MAG: hypothetical protein RL483_1257, partial [Pseudomonadota bacterium]
SQDISKGRLSAMAHMQGPCGICRDKLQEH